MKVHIMQSVQKLVSMVRIRKIFILIVFKQFPELFIIIGPDQILPADNFYTTEANGRVRITLQRGDERWASPMSIPGCLAKIANEYPNRVALVARPDTKHKKSYTYKYVFCGYNIAALLTYNLIPFIFLENTKMR